MGPRVFVALLALAGAAAAEDALKVYRNELKQFRRDDTRFWDRFTSAQNEARVTAFKPYMEMIRAMNKGKGAVRDMVLDLSAYKEIYDQYAAIEGMRGVAARRLARSKHPKALEKLLDVLLDTCREIDATDKELTKNKISGNWGWFDQRAGVRRHGLAIRERHIVEALAEAPEAAAFLASDGYRRAARKDGKRSIARRVALIDALGLSRDPAALGFLTQRMGAKQTYLRIAALEALLRFGPDATPLLAPTLEDASSVVRRALLQGLHAGEDVDPRWIGLLARVLPKYDGVVRADCVAALSALTRQRFGDDPARWNVWWEAHRAAIEAGTFDASKLETVEATTRPGESRIVFFGLPTASRSVIFLLPGGENLLIPADYDVQKTRAWWDWVFTSKWRRKHVTHHVAILRELKQTLERLPKGSTFGMAMVKEAAAVTMLGHPHLRTTNPAHKRQALHWFEAHAPRGFRAELANLVTAFELAGLAPYGLPHVPSPKADTAYMVADGSVRGGRFMAPEAAVAAFERMNRFRRLVVHTIRISNAGPESEWVMMKLAWISGGSYYYARRPR